MNVLVTMLTECGIDSIMRKRLPHNPQVVVTVQIKSGTSKYTATSL